MKNPLLISKNLMERPNYINFSQIRIKWYQFSQIRIKM